MFGLIWLLGALIFVVVGFVFVGYKSAQSRTYDAVEGTFIVVGAGMFWWLSIPTYFLYRFGRWIGTKRTTE